MSGDGKGPTITFPPYDYKKLFELLGERVNNQHDYNHVISWFIQGLSATNIVWFDGTPHLEDPTRGKLLSIGRPVFTAGYYGLNQKNRYLRMSEVTMAGDQGLYMPRPATITAMWGKSRSTGAWSAEVRKNGIPITLISVPIIGSFGSDITLNIDVDAGDHIQFYMNGMSVDHPIVGVELAWRATP
jgi:hypothetical protein